MWAYNVHLERRHRTYFSQFEILARIISGKKLKDVKACWNTLEKLFQFGDIDAANERRSLSEYNTEPFKILTNRITTIVNIRYNLNHILPFLFAFSDPFLLWDNYKHIFVPQVLILPHLSASTFRENPMRRDVLCFRGYHVFQKVIFSLKAKFVQLLARMQLITANIAHKQAALNLYRWDDDWLTTWKIFDQLWPLSNLSAAHVSKKSFV